VQRIALHKVELKVQMCCKKCAEIVDEEIRYLGGKYSPHLITYWFRCSV
jgi:hypothetical protein